MQNEIEINGVRFAVESDFDIEIYSPFVDYEELRVNSGSINPRGTYNQSFKLQGSPELSKLIQMGNVLQKKNGRFEFPNAIQRSNGAIIARGTLSIEEIAGNLNTHNYTVNALFFDKSSQFADAIEGKTLKDLYLHDPIMIPGQDYRNVFQKLQDELGSVNIFHTLLDPAWDVISVKKGEDVFKYMYDYPDDFSIRETSNFCTAITNNVPDTPGLGFFVFPCYRNLQGSERLIGVHNHYKPGEPMPSYFRAAESGSGEEWDNYQSYNNQHIPMYFVNKVLAACFENFGYQLQGDILTDSTFLKLILPNTYSILREAFVRANNFMNTGRQVNLLYFQETTYIESKNHLPDVSVKDFLNALAMQFGWWYDFDGTTVNIRFNEFYRNNNLKVEIDPNYTIRPTDTKGVTYKYSIPTQDDAYTAEKDILDNFWPNVKAASPDDSVLATLNHGDVYLRTDRNELYIKNAFDEAEIYASNIIPYYSGTGRTRQHPLCPVVSTESIYVVPGTSITGMKSYMAAFGHEVTYYFPRAIYYDWVDSITYFQLLKTTEDAPELQEGPVERKLAFYYGIVASLNMDAEGIAVPTMGNSNILPNDTGNVTVADFHLGWNAANGIVESFLQAFMNIFSGARTGRFKAYITFEHLRKFKFGQALNIRGKAYYIPAIRFKAPDVFKGKPVFLDWIEL